MFIEHIISILRLVAAANAAFPSPELKYILKEMNIEINSHNT